MSFECHQFEVPLRLHTEHPFARTITTVAQACAFLKLYPSHKRTAEYYIALGACNAAIEREASAQWAREAFRQFAAKRNLLTFAVKREPIDLDELLIDAA